MAKNRGLGKGIDALFSDYEEEVKSSDVSRETMVNINLIDTNQSQPRSNFDEAALQELAESIKTYGVIEPLIVTKNGNRYDLIAGERRYRASRLAGLKTVPVVIKDYTKDQVFAVALIENIQRQDLNPIEEALAYQKLIEDYQLKQDELATKISKSRTVITNTMRLLKLPKEVQEMVINGEISNGHARALLALSSGKKQIEIANKIVKEELSVRDVEKLVKEISDEKKKDDKKEKKKEHLKEELDLAYQKYETELTSSLGAKTLIKRKNKDKGKIEIEYNSLDELERIYELLKN